MTSLPNVSSMLSSSRRRAASACIGMGWKRTLLRCFLRLDALHLRQTRRLRVTAFWDTQRALSDHARRRDGRMALDDGGLGSIRTEFEEGEGTMVTRHLFALHRRYMVSKAIKRSDSWSHWFFWVRRAEECNLHSVLGVSSNSRKLLDYKRSCRCEF